jgi:ABC-type glycerol-3-phosphate transport system substrate-binding protein
MKLRPFELAVIIFFTVLGLVALFLLANFNGGNSSGDDGQPIIGQVSIWGTLPASAVNSVIREIAEENDQYKSVSYRYVSPANFDDELINSLADGAGPDLILFSHEKLVSMRNRIQPFSYESFPIRDIRNLYIDGAQIFALDNGLYGYPVAVNPLVMYWNKDILANEGYLQPPATWEELVNSAFADLIVRSDDRRVQRSVVAMGEYNNVRNSFGVISALMIQGGSARVVSLSDNRYQVKLESSETSDSNPLRAAADFYTRFSRPDNTLYSWNRSFGEDRSRFLSGDLAFYFGYASEGRELERANPNLNFDIAEIPQGASASVRRTYGDFYSLSLMRSSKNRAGAVAVMTELGSLTNTAQIALNSNMVPALRNAVAAGNDGTYGRVAYRAAPVAFGWLNPNRLATDQIFNTMIEDINSNRRALNSATSDALSRLTGEY